LRLTLILPPKNMLNNVAALAGRLSSRRTLASLAGSVLIFCSPSSTRADSIANVDFNGSSSDLTGNFNQVLTGNNGTPSAPYTWSATAGVAGAGGVIVPSSDVTAIHTPAVIDATSLGNPPLTLTVDFKTPSSLSNSAVNAVAMVGLTAGTASGFGNVSGNVYLGVRVRHTTGNATFLQAQTRTLSGSLVTIPSDSAPNTISLAANTWYRLKLELSLSGVANTFAYTAELSTLGATGTDAPVLLPGASISGTIANADLAGDSTAYAAFRGMGPQIVAAMDNFTAAFVYQHPGMLHAEADFARMRDKVNAGAQPWKGGWDLLVASKNSQSSWVARPASTINRGTSPDNSAQLYNDAAAAYQNALRWKISGDTAHADKAVQILNAWGSTLTSITGNADRYLAAGIYGYEMANAAEIMRTYPGWAAADFARFQNMMLTVFYPMNHAFLVRHNDANVENYWANWDLCNMASILAIGILCDDRAKVDEAVSYFKTGAGQGSINHAIPILHSPTLGQWQESGRDQAHAEMGVGLMATICEMAWHQGIDLYGYENSRFLAGAEYVARYNLGKDVPFAYYSHRSGTGSGSLNTDSVVSSTQRGETRYIWDTIVGHYAERNGIALPEVEQIAASHRPDGGPQYGDHGSEFDHLGFTTLTSYRDPIPTTLSEGVYNVLARHSGKVLTASGNGTTNGTNVEQNTLGDIQSSNSQNWTLSSLGSGQYNLLGAFSGLAVDVAGASTANGANVLLWGINGGSNQKFRLTPSDSGFFRLTPVHSGKCLDVANASPADGANVDQWDYTGASNQQWTFSAATTVRRLRLAGTTNVYLRQSAKRVYLQTQPYPAQDYEFRLVPGFADPAGVSFESVNNPGCYLHVRSDNTVWIDPRDGSSGFDASATFRRVAGLSDSSLYSYQTWTNASLYLLNQSGNVNAGAVSAGNEVNATFQEVFSGPGY
jgi:hypothetical protein